MLITIAFIDVQYLHCVYVFIPTYIIHFIFMAFINMILILIKSVTESIISENTLALMQAESSLSN